MTVALSIARESFPLREKFVISRGARTEAVVITVRLSDGKHIGYGECTPYPRYGETVEEVIEDIQSIAPALEQGLDRPGLLALLPAGAARNAVDCALWDLEAKRAGKPVWQLAGLPEPKPVTSAYTLSLGTPEEMGAAAKRHAHRPLLKVKLTGLGDLDRVRAVRANAPHASLIVDANEAWTLDIWHATVPALQKLGVALIEQPFHAEDDNALEVLDRPIPVCADEACHTCADIPRLVGKYDAFNIKLDKSGGLTEALALAEVGTRAGLTLMCGCMVSTSLAIAPAFLIAQNAAFVDLDAPLNLALDRSHPVRYEGSILQVPTPEVWG